MLFPGAFITRQKKNIVEVFTLCRSLRYLYVNLSTACSVMISVSLARSCSFAKTSFRQKPSERQQRPRFVSDGRTDNSSVFDKLQKGKCFLLKASHN